MKRAAWVKEESFEVWRRALSSVEIDGGGELRVQRHAPKRFGWSASCDCVPHAGRSEVTDVSGFAGSLGDAKEQAERGVRLLGRRIDW